MELENLYILRNIVKDTKADYKTRITNVNNSNIIVCGGNVRCINLNMLILLD